MTLKSLPQLAERFVALEKTAPAISRMGLAAAATAVEDAVLVASGRYAGSSLVHMSIRTTDIEAIIRMVSRKAHLLDRDTKAVDPVLPRKKAAIFIPGSAHPIARGRKGTTKGKQMWERGVAVAAPKIPQIISGIAFQRMASIFGI